MVSNMIHHLVNTNIAIIGVGVFVNLSYIVLEQIPHYFIILQKKDGRHDHELFSDILPHWCTYQQIFFNSM